MSGSAWLHCPCVAPARRARMWLETAGGATAAMGGSIRADRGILRIRLPRPAEVTVLHHGTVAGGAANAERLDLELVAPGPYRAEARIDGRLWLLSNPIHMH